MGDRGNVPGCIGFVALWLLSAFLALSALRLIWKILLWVWR